MTTQKVQTKLDYHDREACREWLQRQVDKPDPEWSTHDPATLRRYQQKVLRWMDCAPEGAAFLVAPLLGFDLKPMGGRSPHGPAWCPCKRIRDLRAADGYDPTSPRIPNPEGAAR